VLIIRTILKIYEDFGEFFYTKELWEKKNEIKNIAQRALKAASLGG